MRRFPPAPLSQRAIWARRLAYFGLAVVIAGMALLRYRPVPVQTGFAVVGAGLAIAAASITAAAWAFFQIWRLGARGAAHAWRAFIVAAAILIWPASMFYIARELPRINDISTDIADPPAFGRSGAAMQARDGHVPAQASEAARQAQAGYYKDIKSLLLELKPEDAYKIVKEAAQKLGWRIVDEQVPTARSPAGRIEAIDVSLLLRFPDDIVIRITPQAKGSRIDIRSVSRFGRSDFGANAKRIRLFLSEAAALASDL